MKFVKRITCCRVVDPELYLPTRQVVCVVDQRKLVGLLAYFVWEVCPSAGDVCPGSCSVVILLEFDDMT